MILELLLQLLDVLTINVSECFSLKRNIFWEKQLKMADLMQRYWKFKEVRRKEDYNTHTEMIIKMQLYNTKNILYIHSV